MMVNFKWTNISIAALFIILLQVANTTQSISYDDFLQCLEHAVTSEVANDNKDSSNLQVSKLPDEILQLMKQGLYENKFLKKFATTTKEDLTKLLVSDMKSLKKYYGKNKKIFKSFTLKVMDKDLKNYPDEDSGVNPVDIAFLSLMTMADVDQIIEETILTKKAPTDESWNVLTLTDAFRTIFFYCKYPKEMAPFLTEKMRVEVKEWLDSTATWGKWGFDDGDASGDNINTSSLKLEL